MCMMEDAEPWTLYRQEERRSARDRRCDECQRDVAKGERYLYWTGLFDGYWSTGQVCLQCYEAARWLRVACEGYLWNAIAEDLAEHVTGEESYLRSAALTRVVRWQAAKWRNRAGELRPVEDVKPVVDRAIASYRAQYEKAVAA